ncbi:MAG TPA: lipoprotein insertase outer membrane protein LolB [Rhodocyclaceae bacterium]|nr:outer membrane lipoprotein LolB [Betaproteobacteria bacterium]HMV00971.1 lipoprotein insertase outer membrane protein LolB [Rhodocyclaceae bacterium]HMV21156.1 lipoprotein insertase outer membrane protein LolB [Rhodocyclaceae bacterium]HMW76869.1 lipoprotein insertase outer membrane protein LolB [Rhodocyclaceae bacterium]HNE43352.1 lipoprotein insertase outer membrane protein LolB [Rhodocyclaceae bacterium]
MRAALAALLVAGCASLPPPEADRERVGDFAVEARFALRTLRPGETVQQASGHLSWSHDREADRILLASPFGQGLAEIVIDSTGARLRTSDGSLRQAADADALLAEATGYRLPLGELPAWLLGRGGPTSQIDRDFAGRPRLIKENAWQIEYGYDDDRPTSLPTRLTVTRDSELDLRLRVEEWRIP